jgi:hypothetical protein
MGSSVGARLVARPAGLSRQEKYLRRSTSKPAAASSASRSRARKSVRWRGASTPFQREPSRRNCQQAALGTCTISRPLGFSRDARGSQVGARIVDVLEHVEHGDAGARRGAQRRLRQIAAEHGHAIGVPGERRGFRRRIQAHSREAALAQQARKQASAAAHVQHRDRILRIRPARGRQTARGRAAPAAGSALPGGRQAAIRRVPIMRGVIARQILGRRQRRQAHQPAAFARDDLKLALVWFRTSGRWPCKAHGTPSGRTPGRQSFMARALCRRIRNLRNRGSQAYCCIIASGAASRL